MRPLLLGLLEPLVLRELKQILPLQVLALSSMNPAPELVQKPESAVGSMALILEETVELGNLQQLERQVGLELAERIGHKHQSE